MSQAEGAPGLEDSRPIEPIAYASADEFMLVRPLLWLILIMPIGITVYDLSRYGMYFFLLASGTGGPMTALSAGEWAAMGADAVKLLVCGWVTYAAAIALQERQLGRVQAACGTMAVTNVSAGLFILFLGWTKIGTRNALPVWYLWQYWIVGSITAVASGITPAAAMVILRHVRRRLPQL